MYYTCAYIYIQEVFGPHSGVWNWSSLTESLYRNRHGKKPLEKRRMNNCLKPSLERLTAREWKIRTEFFLPFPTVYFIVSSPIKNLYRSLKIILKVWNFLWRSLDIDPDIHVMFFITTPLKQDYYLGSLEYNTIYL